MVNGRKLIKTAASEEVFLGLSAFLAGFMLIRMSGIMGGENVGALRTLHAVPALIAAVALSLHLALRLGVRSAQRGAARNTRGVPALSFFFQGGLLVAALGVIVSSLTRFEGSVVLVEGQTYSSEGTGYMEGPRYSRKFAAPPNMELALMDISPSYSDRGTTVGRVRALMHYQRRDHSREKDVTATSWLPAPVDGMFIKIRDFGYAPLYRISGPSGEALDEAYVMLRVSPPGMEDAFTIQSLPNKFYVRYYPDGSAFGAVRQTVAGEQRQPVYKLRVSRNLDLVLPDVTLRPGEKALLGPEYISFIDSKKWVEIGIVKDPGIYVVLAGACLAAAAAAAALFRRMPVVHLISPYGEP